jgi:translation initiation factor 1 (eIF-1/SUI1)
VSKLLYNLNKLSRPIFFNFLAFAFHSMSKHRKSFNTKKSSNIEADYVLVYSTEGLTSSKNVIGSTNTEHDESSKATANLAGIKLVMQYEKKGRAGKAVTMLRKLPADEEFLRNFCVYLKKALGSGGTFYLLESEGVIEIQGDRRNNLPALAQKYLLSLKL